MSTTLYLVRHGNTFEPHEPATYIGCSTDLELTTQGHIQAQAIATYCQEKTIHPNAIYSGTLLRQQQTAAPLAQIRGLTTKTTVILNEINYGEWEGLTPGQISSRWPRAFHAWQVGLKWPTDPFPYTLSHYLQQLQKWLIKIVADHSQETVIAVTSQGIARLILYFCSDLWTNLTEGQQAMAYKIRTGHIGICTLHDNLKLKVHDWNVSPKS